VDRGRYVESARSRYTIVDVATDWFLSQVVFGAFVDSLSFIAGCFLTFRTEANAREA